MSDTKTTKKKQQSGDPTARGSVVSRFKQRLATLPWVRSTLKLAGRLSAGLQATWNWVKLNKGRLIWTGIGVATVVGSGLSLYIWRRELEVLASLVWGKFRDWVGDIFQGETVVIVAESVNQAGVKRVVKRSVATTAENGTGV